MLKCMSRSSLRKEEDRSDLEIRKKMSLRLSKVSRVRWRNKMKKRSQRKEQIRIFSYLSRKRKKEIFKNNK